MRSRILYIPHGGGPLPLLGDPGHKDLVLLLKALATEIGRPAAIVVISAHWEESLPTIVSGQMPGLIYDYYGFPEPAYGIKYPAPGEPRLAKRLHEALAAADIPSRLDPARGFDHGVFVPLAIMYPEANIPCVQLSLVRGLDPESHLRIGQALESLAGEDILVLGSGFSFHNVREFLSDGIDQPDARNDAFQAWLVDTCAGDRHVYQERRDRLAAWSTAPYARYCHPREEHLIPLHVCVGMAGSRAPSARELKVLGKRAVAFLW